MRKYKATLDNGQEITERTVEADSLREAVEIAIWEFGEEGFIIAVEPADETHQGQWMTIHAHGGSRGRYASKDEAIAHNDDGTEILIAIPA